MTNNPQYRVSDNGEAIILCNGATPVEIVLTNLPPSQAAAFALHLNMAVQLGERKESP